MDAALPLPSALRGSVERDIRRLLGEAGVPGAAIAMTTTAGAQTTFFFGQACLDPVRPTTALSRFHLFSGTKLYTAAAVMLLVEQGEVSLDRSITHYLPELALRHSVTVRQLASHDSGIPDTLRAFLSVHPGDAPSVSTADALARYRIDRGRPPGKGARYANVNYALLGELISRCTGNPYESFVEESLLAPLGAALSFRYGDEDRDHAATGYVGRWSPMRFALPFLAPSASSWIFGPRVGGLVPLREYQLDTAAIGGLMGPAQAFLPMLEEMLSTEDGVLTSASKREMLSVQSRGAAGIVSRVGVGLGWKRGSSEVDFWNHEGGGAGFCSETRLYPEAGRGILILLNLSQSTSLSKVCHRICERLRVA